MKLDKFFSSTRKFVFTKYKTIKGPTKEHHTFENANVKDQKQHITGCSANFYRLLESEKEKDDFRQLMHRHMAE